MRWDRVQRKRERVTMQKKWEIEKVRSKEEGRKEEIQKERKKEIEKERIEKEEKMWNDYFLGEEKTNLDQRDEMKRAKEKDKEERNIGWRMSTVYIQI